MILTIRHSRKDKTMKTVKRLLVARDCDRRGGVTRRNTENFNAVKTLYDTIMIYMSVIIHLYKP